MLALLWLVARVGVQASLARVGAQAAFAMVSGQGRLGLGFELRSWDLYQSISIGFRCDVV